MTHHIDPVLKSLGFNQLKAHPFQIYGFRCQPAPLHQATDPKDVGRVFAREGMRIMTPEKAYVATVVRRCRLTSG